MKAGPRHSQAGLTLLEVAIMAFVTSALMVMITQSIASLSSTRGEHRAQANIGRVADQFARLMETDIAFASRVFSDNLVDKAYLAGLAIGPSLPIKDHRLPLLTSRGYFEPDPLNQPETGNVLFLGVRGDRQQVSMSSDPGDTCLVQSLLIVVYSTVSNAQANLDLRRWVSQPLAAYWDIEQVTDSSRKSLLIRKLHEAGVRYAWDHSQPRNTGLFQLQAAGSMSLIASSRLVEGAEDQTASRPFTNRAMRVACNNSLPGTKVPEFARVSGAFPAGFEIKVDGSSGSKLALFRLVVESTLAHRRSVHGEVRRLATTDG